MNSYGKWQLMSWAVLVLTLAVKLVWVSLCVCVCAYVITGADADAVRTSYKRLAQKWYPEKNPKSEEAVQVSPITLSCCSC